MKKLIGVLFFTIILSATVHAHSRNNLIVLKHETSLQNADFGNLVTMLVNGLKPSAFTKDWKTKSVVFMNKIKTQDSKDLTGSASTLFELAKYLNPNAFEDSWKTQKGAFLNGVSNVKNAGDLSKLFSLLLSNISPKYFTKEFKSQVDSLKMSIGKLGSN
jgi:hypothetical protein